MSLAGQSSVVLHLHCASTGGVENFDALEVYAALDGAAFSSTPDVTIQEGNTTDAVSNVTWPYTAHGVAITTAGSPATFNGDGSNGYSTIRIRIPDGSSSVSVKIASANSATNEYYQVDDIELTSGTLVFHDPPVLAPAGDRAGNAGTSLLFSLSASDPDEDPITLIASNLPPGAVFVDMGNGSGNFTWAYPASVGVYTSSFHAVTMDGSDGEQIRITIGETVISTNVSLTVMAANLTSGSSQAYEDPGIRIFQGLKPDVVACLQEFNYSQGLRTLVDTAFGTNYYYFCRGRQRADPQRHRQPLPDPVFRRVARPLRVQPRHGVGDPGHPRHAGTARRQRSLPDHRHHGTEQPGHLPARMHPDQLAERGLRRGGRRFQYRQPR